MAKQHIHIIFHYITTTSPPLKPFIFNDFCYITTTSLKISIFPQLAALMKQLLLTILLFWIFCSAFGQNTIGLPEIANYYKQAYRGGAQNRQIRQDRNGILYFANSEGVLSFDGVYWKTYPLPNKSIVRSLDFGPDNKLYVGGQDEFGYFSTDKQGKLVYNSLKHLVPEGERSFTDVWNIFFYNRKTFFQTSNKIFEISEGHCTVYKSERWRFIGLSNNQLIAQDHNKGLLQFKNGVWAPFITASEFPDDYFVTSVTPISKDSSLITTIKHGVFVLSGNRVTRLQSPFLASIANKFISSSAVINENHIALATNLDGCFIIDRQGALVQSFSRKEGLQNNNILDIFIDKEKNMWLGLDNGIDFIAYSNAIKHIYPDGQNEGSGYAALIHNNSLFVGTSNGLYKVPLYNQQDLSYVKGAFEPVANTRGQVWNLSEVNGQLLLGHHDGAFVIENNSARPFDNTSGFWTFLPYANVLPSSTIVTGSYQGINFYQYQNGKIINNNTNAHFESARFVLVDNGTVWVSHPYKGIYAVKPSAGAGWHVKQYGPKEGITSVNNNYIFRISNQVLVCTEKGIYEYNRGTDAFQPATFYNNLFKGKSIRHLKEDGAGNIWFVHDKLLGVVTRSGPKPEIIYLTELTNKYVSGFEYIYPVNNNNIFIGAEKGFYHINFEQYRKNKCPLQVHLRTVKAINERDSTLFGGYLGEVNVINDSVKQHRTTVDHSWNSFLFEFSAPVYGQQANIEYSYYLEGFDDKWSEYSKKTDKEYTKLSAGTYTFRVKARNNLGDESEVSSYTFTVLPPWYQTYWAYFLYTLLFLGGLYLLYIIQKRKYVKQLQQYEEEQKRLQYLHQLELEKNEKEIIKLRNEKLEAEINHKNKELASTAMHLVQKGEMFTKIKEEVIKLKKTTPVEKSSDDLKKIIRIISEDDKMDEDWEHFAIHFDKVHSDFLLAVKEHHPKLTPNELKLCAYLRMNMSTKEIAQLMNISVRGVEISRYRLRKKLQIPTEMNLFDYLLNFQSHKPESKPTSINTTNLIEE